MIVRAAEREAFRAYVSTRSPALLRTAYLLTGDQHDAEDLLQESLVKLARAWHRIQSRESTDAYLRRIMVNQRTTAWRRRRVDSVSVADPETSATTAAFMILDGAGAHAERDEMWLALATLPPRMRAVLVLRFYEDLTEAEAAVALGCSVGTVKSQSSRALAKLRDTLPAHKEQPC